MAASDTEKGDGSGDEKCNLEDIPVTPITGGQTSNHPDS